MKKNKFNTRTVLAIGIVVVSAIGKLMTNKMEAKDREEFKDELKLELKDEILSEIHMSK